ncbi:hypothetical protein [Streptomyces sp. NPDC002758]
MTTKAKAQAETEPTEEPAKAKEATPLCGAPHFLPMLAHLTCTEPAPDPDRPPGTPEHEHRHQDGDAIYTWQ